MAKDSPFAGKKLTDSAGAPAPALDQRLFGTPPPTPRIAPGTENELVQPAFFKEAPTPPDSPSQVSPALEPRKQRSKEPRNVGTKEGTFERTNVQKLDVAEGGADSPQIFDLNIKPYKRNSYDFTNEELDALEDTAIEIKRTYDVNATKNDLIRVGLHWLLQDYRKQGPASFIVAKLKAKKPR